MASKPIVQPVQSRLVQSLTGPLYPTLTGSQHGTIPVWTPKSALWRLVCDVTVGEADIAMQLLADADSSAERLIRYATNLFSFMFTDTSGASRSLSSPVVTEVGKRYLIVVEGFAAGTALTVNGVTATTAYAADPADINLIRLATSDTATSLFWRGPIHRCEFIDLSPLQSVRAMACASTRVPKIPAINLGIGSTIEVWIKHKLDAGAQSLFGFTGTASPVTITNGVVASSGPITLTQDGVAVSGSLADGRHCTLKATTTSAVTLTTLGENNAAANRLLDVAVWRIWDAATGKVWEYNNANDTGNLLVNSSNVDRLGPKLWDGVTPYAIQSPVWTNSGGGRYLLDSDGSTPDSMQPLANATLSDQRIRLSFEVSNYSGTGGLTYIGSGGTTITANGRYEFDVSPTGSIAILFKRATSGKPVKATISNISIRRIYALKTAEGAYRTSVNGYVAPSEWRYSDGIHHFTGASSYSAITLEGLGSDLITGHIEVEVELERISGTANIELYARNSLNTNNTTWGVLTEGKNRFFVATYGYSYSGRVLWIDKTPATTEYKLKNLRWRKVTHGLWHQSGAVMADTAANVARAYLPPISRTYDFADAIRVQDGNFVGSTDVPDNNGQNPVVWTGLTADNIQ